MSSEPATVSIPSASNPTAPVLTKTATLTGTANDQPVVAGDVVLYTFTVTNPGNVTLDNITVNDEMSGLSGIVCYATTLGPGQSTTCQATYTLTQTDIDRGSLTNAATATGYTPSDYAPNPSGPLTSSEATATVPLPPQPSLALQKSAAVTATGPNGALLAGDSIDYTYVVTNTGNVSVSDIDVSDDLAGLSSIACATYALAPQASTSCSAVYTVTQADVDAGSVVNTASVSAKDPAGNAVPPAKAGNTVDVPGTASLSLVKTASISPNTAGLDTFGAVITYTYTVENTGTVTLSSLQIQDSRLPSSAITCPTTALAPGTAVTCSAVYTVTQADVNRGSVLNTAVAKASSRLGAVASNPARAKVKLLQVESLSLVKSGALTPPGPSGTPSGPNGIVLADDAISYSYTVTNTGTVTLHTLRIVDNLLGSSAIVCPASPLGPGSTATCAASYIVTQNDINSGDVVNTALAIGLSPKGQIVVSGFAHAQVPLAQAPSLTLTKTATTMSTTTGTAGANVALPGLGDIVHYTYGVTNTGNVPISNLGVVDALPGLVPSPPRAR